MNIKKDKDFDIEKFLDGYKKDLISNLSKEKIYIVDLEKKEILKEIIYSELTENYLNDNSIYLPITTAIYDDMKLLNGDEVDLNEGLEAEYVEGFAYMPTSGRMIDIGDLEVSLRKEAALIINKDKDFYSIILVEGTLNKNHQLESYRPIKNGGIVEVEMRKYI